MPQPTHGLPPPSCADARIAAFASEESAQDLIEYALLGAMIALLLVGILPHVTDSVNARYERAGSSLRTITYECPDPHPEPKGTEEPPSHCD